jgi:AcrR family transcriptional regulator
MQDVVVRGEATSVELASESREARERLADAVTRAAADYGYGALDVGTIVRYAGLTVEDFDRHFRSVDQCMLAGLDRFMERMYAHVEEACEAIADWPGQVRAAATAAIDFIVELEPVFRVFAVDVARLGEAVIERRFAAVDGAARRLKHGRLLYPRAADLPDAMERILVAGVVSLARRALLHQDARTELPLLAPEVVEMVLTPYLGQEPARALAAA